MLYFSLTAVTLIRRGDNTRHSKASSLLINDQLSVTSNGVTKKNKCRLAAQTILFASFKRERQITRCLNFNVSKRIFFSLLCYVSTCFH